MIASPCLRVFGKLNFTPICFFHGPQAEFHGSPAEFHGSQAEFHGSQPEFSRSCGCLVLEGFQSVRYLSHNFCEVLGCVVLNFSAFLEFPGAPLVNMYKIAYDSV